MSEPVAIVTGSGLGYTANVNSDGQVSTETEVVGTVDTKPSAAGMFRTSVTVQTSSGTLVAARTGRRWLCVQNQGVNPVYLRFEAAAATNADWLVPPATEYRSETFPYAGEIRAIAVGGTSVVLVLEMA